MDNMKTLIVDDEALFCDEIAAILNERGFSCKSARDGRTGLEIASEFLPDVVICDLSMPDMDGLKVLERLRCELPETHIIIITAFGTMENVIEAFRKGASDYVLKPLNIDELIRKIRQIERQRALLAELRELRRKVNTPPQATQFIGQSPAIREILTLVDQLAPVDSSVLLLGETGTGKEVVARLLHERSHRRNKPFIALNCAAVPETLIESELFGHVRGAFTGATHDKTGLFAAACGGSLFLDEFCEMPASLQGKLLRAIERKEVMPVGSASLIPVNVRLIAATNRDPMAYVKESKLREDLFYRIRVMELSLPPLRQRREDIPLLAQHFVDRFNQEMKRNVQGISNAALQALMLYGWPGNVRELKNAVERAMIFTTSGFLELRHFPVEVGNAQNNVAVPDELKAALCAYENAHILAVLNKAGGNRAYASQLLGMDRSTLHRKLTAMQ